MNMDMKIDKICRCCLREPKSKMKTMLDPFNNSKTTFLESYTLCSGINLQPETSCKQICNKCENKLKISYEFRELCHKSHQILQDIADDTEIKTEVLSDNDEVNDMEIVFSEGNGKLIHQVFVHDVEQPRPDDVKIEEQPAEEEEKIVVEPDEGSDGGHDDEMGMDYEDEEDDVVVSKVKVELGKVKVDMEEKTRAANQEETESATDSVISSYILEGNFVCEICDAMVNTSRELNEHKKSHLWVIKV
jgi:hypothetical protein